MDKGRVGSRRTERTKTKTAGTKKLGRVARLAIFHNDDEAEKFIATVESGKETHLQMGVVQRAYGGGAFSVKAGGKTFDASLRGMLMGRGRFHHNPEATTAVRVGSSVVLDGDQIMSVLSSGQASRARKALGASSGRRSSSNKGYVFNRASEEKRDAAERAAMVAGLDLGRSKSKSSSRRSSSKRNRSWFSFF